MKLCVFGIHKNTAFADRLGQPEDFKAGYSPGARYYFRVCEHCGKPKQTKRRKKWKTETR